MHTNRLAQEKSPYLLQHAHNPVEWYPWGPEAFERARREDKPIFLSVGYSTCHWCHVMERESFENEAIAAILNRYFVAVKVDREERPDVDRIYMSFVQATTGSGGWPMSVWLTPELEPFVGGTYFPPEDRYGRAGFPVLLERIADAWRNDREKIVESARDVVQQLQRAAEVSTPRAGLPAPGAVESGFWAFRRTYDSRYGGFGQAPKFPRPSVLNFLLRYHARTKNQEALDMVLHTLREMARGGMYDQLSGGFHRYSVDERWFVPHFEKMLYDQAQLAVSYLEAFQITGDHVYAGTARETLDYVLRDMLDEAGGFYSAEDADSVIDPAHPDIKGEGAFYIWSEAELREALASPVDDWFCYRYGVEKNGNVVNDPHEEFTGKNILYQAHSIEETASHFNRALPEVQAGVLQARRKLLELRSHRVRPHLDDKVLTAWNGLMISAFAKAGAILSAKTYADAARRAADFLIGHMSNPTLLRRYRQGDAAISGFLDDYAYFTQALIDLYESQFHLPDLQLATRLADRMRELFEDRQNGGFYSTAEGDTALVVRMKDDYDSAEPSGNSIAVSVLLRLAQMADREDFRQSAEKAIAAFHSRITRLPDAVPQMLAACEFALAKPRQIVIAGEISSPDTQELAGQAHARFLPNSVLVLASAEARASVPALAPMKPVADRATAYVCENYACQAPVSDASQLAELLQ